MNPWESIDNFGINRLEPRACFTPYTDPDSARNATTGASTLVQSLNGAWKFHYADLPLAAPEGFEKPVVEFLPGTAGDKFANRHFRNPAGGATQQVLDV